MAPAVFKSVRLSARDLISRRYYPLFFAIEFVVTLLVSYALVSPINEMDWIRTGQQVRNLWRGINPYCAPYCEFHDFDADFTVDEAFVSVKVYSPWVMFYFAPLYYASTRVILALTVTCWIMIMLDSGHLPALLLILHPAFIMLWASSNPDFVINGVGLWLIWRGVRGARRGVALMLMAIKPQILLLFLVLEGLRVLWERDWAALGVMVGLGAVSVVLYPSWLLDTLPALVGLKTSVSPEESAGFGKLFSYPFSVYAAWGVLAAAGFSVLILVLMRRRLTEWRTLSVLLSLVWAPHLSLYNYVLPLLLFRKAKAWRVLTYLTVSLLMLPVFFTEYHHYERYGVLGFLLLAVLLSPPDAEQTEEAIAQRNHQPLFPPVRPLVRWLAKHNARSTRKQTPPGAAEPQRAVM